MQILGFLHGLELVIFPVENNSQPENKQLKKMYAQKVIETAYIQ